MQASYSPEDNKLRLYPSSRLSPETYARVKAAGFSWAPKQELFVAPGWTPAREDLLLELCGEIGDEDYSPLERSADRAERFTGYRDKRTTEAEAGAESFESGPKAYGNQSYDRAARQAARADRTRHRACSQWGKAEYWQQRTEGVIAHALYKAKPAVRRSRIVRLEAEQRKHEKRRTEYAQRWAGWHKVLTLDGLDTPISADGATSSSETLSMPAGRLTYYLANHGHDGFDFAHPRTGRESSLYGLLTDPIDPITPREAAALWLDGRTDPSDQDSSSARWSDHYANRLAYERAMLANEGGTAADADMEPGGWIGQRQIQAVTRSSVTKRVTSVKIFAPKRWHNGQGPAPLELQSFSVERLPEGAYRPPTEEERADFQEATKARKATEKASKPKSPPLINPTDEDAERLQSLWNARAKARHDQARAEGRCWSDYIPTMVKRMTQEQYSARSGNNGNCETVEVCQDGFRPRRWHEYKAAVNPPIACKVRKGYAGTGITSSDDAVIVLTDKPQKPLPLDWEAIKSGAAVAPEAVPA